MKKTTILLALLLLYGLGYAQQNENLQTKRQKLSKEENINFLAEKRLSRKASNSQKATLHTPNRFSTDNESPLIYVTSLWGADPGIFETTLENFDEGTKLTGIDLSFQAMERTSDENIYVAIWSDEGGFWGTNYFGKIDAAGNLTFIAEDIELDGISMAWNSITETMYVISLFGEFGTVDITSGEFTLIADLDWWYTIAIDNNGICYALEWDGGFGTMDLATGAFTPIADLPGAVFDFQGMKFNRETNELYWQAVFDEGPETDFYNIDPITGNLTLLGQVAERFFDFVIMDPDDDGGTSITEWMDLNNPLKAWVQDHKLHVGGLTIGERWTIYNIKGQLVYQSIANNDVMSVNLDIRGTYIIQSGKRVVKVVF
ncbi:MAG: hypothetical protein FWE63_07230 [Bacteroidales bacterium]|nr:hypothetical protein [Bacteroidales bacterium]